MTFGWFNFYTDFDISNRLESFVKFASRFVIQDKHREGWRVALIKKRTDWRQEIKENLKRFLVQLLAIRLSA